jgi:hypothetical protein
VIAALSGKTAAGTDIAKLQPVQVVHLSCSEGQVVVRTDTGDWGMGETLKDALRNMMAASPQEIFLDTADYLLLSENCIDLLPAMMRYLRPSCAVCLSEGAPDMGQVGAFLQHHAPKATLVRYRAGVRQLQTLVTREGRMELVS